MRKGHGHIGPLDGWTLRRGCAVLASVSNASLRPQRMTHLLLVNRSRMKKLRTGGFVCISCMVAGRLPMLAPKPEMATIVRKFGSAPRQMARSLIDAAWELVGGRHR